MKPVKINTSSTQYCFIGDTNETYERFVFNSRAEKEGETIEQYKTALRTLAQTCNFCTCLHESLLRDRVVLGIQDNSVRKKLLQERQLHLAKALDICRSSETTASQLKSMSDITSKPSADEIKLLKKQNDKGESRRNE